MTNQALAPAEPDWLPADAGHNPARALEAAVRSAAGTSAADQPTSGAANAAEATSGAANAAASGPSVGPRADTLAAGLVLVIALNVVQRGLGFVREILFCRWLSHEELGQWAMSLLFITTAAALVTLGIQGSMSRYLAHYRSRGQLRAYLKRVACTSALLALGGGAMIWAFRETFSTLIYGRPDRIELVVLVAVSVAVVAANNFFVELFTALRLMRVTSALHMIGSLGFVVISVAAMLFWQPAAASLVVSLAAASLAVIAIGGLLGAGAWRQFPADRAPLEHARFWPKLVRFGMALWIYNCLVNLFEATDRYMIVHAGGMDELAALAAVADYHSARVVPLLLATLAALVASTMMPHLSHAWESGRRDEVAQRMVLTLKLMGLLLTLGAAAVLVAAPLLFDMLLDGKFAGGRAVLPGVLATCAWYGLIALAFNYLWCVERLGLCAAALAVGLVVNVVLNFLLLPLYGLPGAVAATAAAHLVQLLLVYLLGRRYGLPLDLGLWLATLMPAAVLAGPQAAAAVVAGWTMLALSGDLMLTPWQRRELAAAWRRVSGRRTTAAPDAS